MSGTMFTVSRRLGALLLLCAFSMPALANEAAAKAAAVQMVERAVAMHGASGKDKTLAAINQKDGPFHKGELYAFAYDAKGVVIAHPVNAKLIGKNLVDVADPDGKTYRKLIVQIAAEKGSGWMDYKYKNPESGRVEPKTTFFRRVDDVIYLCGVYQ